MRSNPGIGDKRYRRSKLKKYNESVELSSEEESSSSDDDQPRGSRTMRPAVSKTHTRSTRILDSETQANDDLEIVSVSTIKPSLPSRSHNPQEAKSNFKPEFPSDPEQPTATILPAHVINATSLLVSLSNQPDRAPANGKFPIISPQPIEKHNTNTRFNNPQSPFPNASTLPSSSKPSSPNVTSKAKPPAN